MQEDDIYFWRVLDEHSYICFDSKDGRGAEKAKTAERDEELKRCVAVVRSLCDVVLDQPETASAPAYSRAARRVLPHRHRQTS